MFQLIKRLLGRRDFYYQYLFSCLEADPDSRGKIGTHATNASQLGYELFDQKVDGLTYYLFFRKKVYR